MSTTSTPQDAQNNDGSTSQNTQIASSTAPASATLTVTEENDSGGSFVFPLVLEPRPRVHWDEGIYNNEGMGRKSSKRCCIFHKQREFGESSTESSDSEDDSDYERIDSDDEMQENNLTNQNCDTSNNDTTTEFQGKIARKKMSKKTVPAYQRYHA